MPTNEHEQSSGENDRIFDAIVESSYGDDERDLIKFLDTFDSDGDNFNRKAEQFMKNGWEPKVHVWSSVMNELSSISTSLEAAVHLVIRSNQPDYAAKEIAEVIVLDRKKRINYFTNISTVVFMQFSDESEMQALFQDVIETDNEIEHIAHQIVAYYKTELLSQFMSLTRAHLI